MMEMRAQHARGGVGRRQQRASAAASDRPAAAAAVKSASTWRPGVAWTVTCDPLDQPVLLEEPPPQVLPLVPVPPKRAPGALAPVMASTTITA